MRGIFAGAVVVFVAAVPTSAEAIDYISQFRSLDANASQYCCCSRGEFRTRFLVRNGRRRGRYDGISAPSSRIGFCQPDVRSFGSVGQHCRVALALAVAGIVVPEAAVVNCRLSYRSMHRRPISRC